MDEWIRQTYFITVNGGEIIFPVNAEVNILTPVTAFTGYFGSAIDAALASGADPRQAIINSDPDNFLGFNGYV